MRCCLQLSLIWSACFVIQHVGVALWPYGIVLFQRISMSEFVSKFQANFVLFWMSNSSTSRESNLQSPWHNTWHSSPDMGIGLIVGILLGLCFYSLFLQIYFCFSLLFVLNLLNGCWWIFVVCSGWRTTWPNLTCSVLNQSLLIRRMEPTARTWWYFSFSQSSVFIISNSWLALKFKWNSPRIQH